MDTRLIEAAKKGDVEKLHNLIKDNPFLLSAAALGDGDTPLHIACVGGHVEFVKEVLIIGQEFAGEFNQDGFSPLHIACARGDVEIVKELLKVGTHICLAKGKERRIPLHSAVAKGRIHVITELLQACSDSITRVTARGETCFHLAAKNNQYEALKVLCEHVASSNQEDILNSKDDRGNSILHLAASRKQYEVLDLLLSCYKEKLDVNSMNKKGLTPFDILISEGGDTDIEEMLTLAGASPRNLLIQIQDQSSNAPEQERRRRCRPKSASLKLQDYFKYDKVKESPSKARNTLLVITVLIATATYQAVLSPPGGVWQDDFWPDANSSSKQPPHHTAGKSVMSTHNYISYGLFLLFNSMGFFMSLHMMNFLTLGLPLQFELRVALIALTATYDTCMVAIAPSGKISTFFIVLSVLMPVIMALLTKYLSEMDRKNLLFEAAREGKLEVLERLIQENPSILADIRLISPAESVLHVATKHGQSNFVHELMKVDPDIATDMDQYGFRPLDIASIMGKIATVKTILSFNGDLWRLAGKDSRTALHYAAIKGRVEIIHELLSTCPDCLEDITVHGETALHLAVKYYQLDAFNEIVNWLERLSKAPFINFQDGDGNTALHLAVSTKQYGCLNQLLDENNLMKGTTELNVINSKGLTPLDVLDMSVQDFYDIKIKETLQNAGAIKAQDSTTISLQLETNPQPLQQNDVHHQLQPDSRNWFKYFKFQKQRDSPSEARNALLVVAALITTVTFQAAVSPPSGLFDESRMSSNSTNESVGMAFRTDFMFVFFNSVGFVTSSLIISYLTTGFPLYREVVVSLGCMFITYSAAINMNVEGSKAGGKIQGIAWYVQLVALILPHLFRRPPWLRKRNWSCWRSSRQVT